MTDAQGTRQLRGAAYERVSRSGGRTADELAATTLREQRELYEPFLRTLPGKPELVERLTDVDQSGASASRPQLDRLFELVDAGKLDVVIVGYLSRFGRSASQILGNVERLKRAGVVFVSARERIVVDAERPDPYAIVMLAVLAAIAEVERERLREGLASANANAIDDGRSIAVPYGYKRENGSRSALVIDDELDEHTGELAPADVVRLIFARRLDGVGASQIAHELNDRGVPTPTSLEHARGARREPGAAQWRHNTVRGIVETHSYKGVIPRWRYELVGDKRVRVDDSLELLPALHDELVDESVWLAAQFTGKRRVRNGKTSGSLLEGLVRCASCSQTMRPSTHGAGKLAYVCTGKQRGCTTPARMARSLADEYVLAEVERMLEHEGAIGHRVADRGDVEHALLDADERVEHAKAELDAFLASGSPLEHGANFGPLSQRFRAAYDEALVIRDELKRELEQPRDELTLSQWRELTTSERRERLRETFDAVVVTPAPGRGRSGVVDERVHLIVDSPIVLGGTGRIVANRPFPLDAH